MKLDHPFLHDVALRRVLTAMEQAGGQVRVVGGAVRDAIAGRKVGDIDLACTLPPEEVTKAAEAAGLKVVPTGLKQGTVTVIADHQPFEVTTLRRDVATDGRHAEVAFTTDWREDAARRDFTMNALYCDAAGEVTDFFDGIADLKVGRVKFVGNPLLRIKEDVLRILRFFRFHAHFGSGAPDPAGLMACGMLAPLLPSLSRERVRVELLKLLSAPAPQGVWREMIACGAIDALKLALHNVERLEALVELEERLNNRAQLRRLYALTDPETDTDELAEQLRLSGAESLRLRAMAQPMLLPKDTAGLLRQAYWHGAEVVADHLLLAGTANGGGLTALAAFKKPAFPLTGDDLLKLGHAPGPRLGELLKRLEKWWVEQDFTPDKAAFLKNLTEKRSDQLD